MDPTINPLGRALGLLIEPRRILDDIRRKPDLLGPVIIVLLGALFALPVQEYSQQIYDIYPMPLPRYLSLFTQSLAALLGWLLMGLIYLIFTRILGSRISYRHLLSLTGYIQFIPLLGNLIGTAGLVLTGHLITLSPAFFLDHQDRLYSPLGAFLERFNIIYLVTLFLLGMGLHRVAGLSRLRVSLLIIFFWVVGTVFSVMGAFLF